MGIRFCPLRSLRPVFEFFSLSLFFFIFIVNINGNYDRFIIIVCTNSYELLRLRDSIHRMNEISDVIKKNFRTRKHGGSIEEERSVLSSFPCRDFTCVGTLSSRTSLGWPAGEN